MYKALNDAKKESVADGRKKDPIFGICHVLRYSPHNMLLRHLVREKEVVGDILSIEHCEPVGWWHFSHSYVR
jgi:predicted dehydrogenase